MSEDFEKEVKKIYPTRRQFMGMGALGLVGLLAACGDSTPTPLPAATTAAAAATTAAAVPATTAAVPATTAASGVVTAVSVAGKKPKVGLVMKSLANEFFQQMQAGADTFAKANTDKFEFKAVGMKDERDFAAQVDAVENFITQKYDIIVVAAADSKAMVTPLAKAVKAGIVVINIDVELDKEAKKAAGTDLAFFGPDNAAGSKMVGDALAKVLGPGGKVVILEGNPEADNAQQRKKGFDQAVAEGKLTLLDSKTAHWETEEANTLMTNFLTKYPDIQGVMAANDSMALGVVKALDAAGKSGKIKVVGFDNIPAVLPLIKAEKMLATVEQFGAQMAVFGINYGLRTMNGEKFTGWVQTPLKLITLADLPK